MVQNLKGIKAFLLDVDGVMTDGSIIVDPNAEPLRIFNEKDGHALRMAALNGYLLGVITGSNTEAVRKRLTAYGIPYQNIFLKVRNKRRSISQFCDTYKLRAEEVLYMGDDIPDVPALEFAGLGAVPADAAAEAKAAADLVSPIPGGRGFVRWVLEMVMKEQGKWIFDVDKYENMF